MQNKFGNIVRCLYKYFLLKFVLCDSQINIVYRFIYSCDGIGLKLEFILSGVNFLEFIGMLICFKLYDFKLIFDFRYLRFVVSRDIQNCKCFYLLVYMYS